MQSRVRVWGKSGSEARNMLNAYIYRKHENENFWGIKEKEMFADQTKHYT